MFGIRIADASLVRNPYRVPYDPDVKWNRSETLQLATVGRLECYHKGNDLLIEALVEGGWERIDFNLNVYGEGYHKELIERLWVNGGLPANRLRFHGHIQKIEDVWRENHVLIQPSRLEGLPLSVVEAMLCSRPVVATDVGGHVEVIEDGKTGFIAEAATVRHVKAALDQLLEHRSSLEQLGKAARSKIESIIPVDPIGGFIHELEYRKFISRINFDILSEISVFPLPTDEDEFLIAHVFVENDRFFSEDHKVEVHFCRKTNSRIIIPNCRGRIRFDPSTQKGLMSIRSISVLTHDYQRYCFEGDELEQILQVEGTARSVAPKGIGLEIESTGDDPILIVDLSPFGLSEGFTMEISIYAE
jgi:hypothetical protein